MVTHSRDETTRPTQRLNLHVSFVSSLPKSYRDGFTDPNWQNLYYLADDTLSRYKARLVENGSTQLEVVDVDETFCPVVKPYRGVVNAVVKTCWLRNLLRELHTPLSFVTLVYCDNVIAVYSSCNLVQHQRTKHIKIDIHFVRDLIAVGQVRVLHVPSRYQFADIFIKGLPSALFEEFCSSLSVWCPLAPTAGEC
ncbi:ribonuclease H-like domain-containing protein [Tanacetum coccineum]